MENKFTKLHILLTEYLKYGPTPSVELLNNELAQISYNGRIYRFNFINKSITFEEYWTRLGKYIESPIPQESIHGELDKFILLFESRLRNHLERDLEKERIKKLVDEKIKEIYGITI